MSNPDAEDSDEKRHFQSVLDELRILLIRFREVGIDVMLVGAQVLAVEALAAGGDGAIQVSTPTGVTLRRGYSMEPDLLFDVETFASRADSIPEILRECKFEWSRQSRWSKSLSTGTILLDLFMPSDADEASPGGLERLPKGDVALLRPQRVNLTLGSGYLSIAVPDAVGFLAMKLRAKLELRPKETKDSFDIYAYIAMKGSAAIASALRKDTVDGPKVAADLRTLFGSTSSSGVSDVLAFASTLEATDRDLLARSIVDLVTEALAT